MKCFIVLSALVAVALARPGHLLESSYHVSHVIPESHGKLVPAPIGHDGRVVDTPEVAHAKAEHEAAHAHEKIALSHESSNHADEHWAYEAAPAHEATIYHAEPLTYTKIVPAAPIGHDGRVVDTPEVAHAKAEHEAAHAHEKIALSHESSNHDDEHWTYEAAPAHESTIYHAEPLTYTKIVSAAPIGHDGRVVDTPEVAHAKAAHEAAHAHEKIALSHESSNHADEHWTYEAAPAHETTIYHVEPLTYTKIVPAAPIGHDGRVVDTPEVAHAKAAHEAAHAHEKIALSHESSSHADEHWTYDAAPAHETTIYHAEPLTYTKIIPAAPIGHDGRVVDTPEVAHAKAEHEAAHAHEKIALSHESSNHADEHWTYDAAPAHETTIYHAEPLTYTKIVPAAPLDHDGRVVDTPEIAHLKAEHLAAHEQAKAALHAEPQGHLESAHSDGSYASHYESAHQW